MEPKFFTTYLYKMDKNGLIFPSRVKARVGYPLHVSSELYRTKIKTKINYDKYQFFIVETKTHFKKIISWKWIIFY
jgi:hypothetical protein